MTDQPNDTIKPATLLDFNDALSITRILSLLERGRTDGGEVITSAKHAAKVIRRDIFGREKDHDGNGAPCDFCGGVHYGTPKGLCVYRCAACGADTRTPIDLTILKRERLTEEARECIAEEVIRFFVRIDDPRREEFKRVILAMIHA